MPFLVVFNESNLTSTSQNSGSLEDLTGPKSSLYEELEEDFVSSFKNSAIKWWGKALASEISVSKTWRQTRGAAWGWIVM